MMRAISLLSVLLLLTTALPAQNPTPQNPTPQDPTPQELELGQQAAAILLPLARQCESSKALAQAKAVYEQILDYDPENRPARTALGFSKTGGKWRASTKQKEWKDRANDAQRNLIATAWANAKQQLAALHRDLGLALLATDKPRAEKHLQRALGYDPNDKAAHQGLGHQEHEGFFGTQEQVAFLDHMQALRAGVKAIQAKTYPVEAIPQEQLPPELKNSGLGFFGAKSPHFTLWVRDSQPAADDCVQWAERARDWLILILGERSLATLNFERRLTYDYIAFVWESSERDQFLAANKDTWAGQDPTAIRMFDDFFWDRPDKRRGAIVYTIPERLLDRIVGFVAFQGFIQGRNEGLGEGLLHASTFNLLGTTWTWYGALPSTKSSGEDVLRPDPSAWLVRLREQLEKREDWPIQQLPREVLTQYRPQVRIKAWYLMCWLLARYPDQWLPFYLELSKHKSLMPEQVEAIGKQVFGRSLLDIEQEWREWANGKSEVAKASGYGG